MAELTKSTLLYAYNLAREAIRKSIRDGELHDDNFPHGLVEMGRLRRALGIAMSKDKGMKYAQYHTEITSCQCPDNIHNKQYICKHRLARMLEFRATHPKAPDWREYARALMYGKASGKLN